MPMARKAWWRWSTETCLPNGFLVYYGADEASAVLATNSGSDGSGNNIWAIPAVSGLPAYIAVLPPPYWSGSVTGLEFTVLTQDAGLSPRESSSSFDLSVAASPMSLS